MIPARAMKGDREYCLAVGMNYYISKLINASELALIISQYIH